MIRNIRECFRPNSLIERFERKTRYPVEIRRQKNNSVKRVITSWSSIRADTLYELFSCRGVFERFFLPNEARVFRLHVTVL